MQQESSLFVTDIDNYLDLLCVIFGVATVGATIYTRLSVTTIIEVILIDYTLYLCNNFCIFRNS